MVLFRSTWELASAPTVHVKIQVQSQHGVVPGDAHQQDKQKTDRFSQQQHYRQIGVKNLLW